MTKLSFEWNGKTYEVYGKAQQLDVCYQPHIFEVETACVPDNQMKILKEYFIANGICGDELNAATTYELVYMAKRFISKKNKS